MEMMSTSPEEIRMLAANCRQQAKELEDKARKLEEDSLSKEVREQRSLNAAINNAVFYYGHAPGWMGDRSKQVAAFKDSLNEAGYVVIRKDGQDGKYHL